ncbi:MAG TPA: class II fumarate hydratase [Planctomycetota bacterium]|nr:class II fumarate hydratase [Planctomycetota bacterium]
MASMRIEKDSLGPVHVPREAYFGAQTQRAVENFPVSGRRMPRPFIAALAHLKSACAEVNRALYPERMPVRIAKAIQGACVRVAEGELDSHFPVDVFQTGSGTSSNMNANEVIANLANEKLGGRRGVYTPVHPNDHVNLGQSSNDIIPSAAHLAALLELRPLRDAVRKLCRGLDAKSKDFNRVLKLGRTHLMDAVPVTMGQEFGGYAEQVRKAGEHLDHASKELEELALGGTAVGTGLNAHPQFAKRVCALLAKRLALPVREARNHFEAQGGRDAIARVSGALKALACALIKIANDIRWMGSGPFGGLAELQIPDLQPGSSIMPGKVNPVMSEMLVQVAAQVIGNDAAVTIGAQGGHFELNTMIPVMAANLLDSIRILGRGCALFQANCVDGLKADAARCAELLARSPIAATALNPVLGYDRTAELIKEALASKRSVKDLAVEQGLITKKQADRIFDFRRLTEPDRNA